MKHTSLSITAGLALACLLASFAVPQGVFAGKGEAHTQIDVQSDGISAAFTAHSSQDLLSLTVRVSGPNGVVFEKRVEGPMIEWVPDEKLVQGTYSWEARAVTAERGAPQRELQVGTRPKLAADSEEAEGMAKAQAPEPVPIPIERRYEAEHKSVLVKSGIFQADWNGILEVPEDNEAIGRELSATEDTTSSWARLTQAIVDFVFPTAVAGTCASPCEVNGGASVVEVTLLPSSTNNWEIEAQTSTLGIGAEGTGSGSEIIRIDHSAPGNSLRIDSDGDVGLGTSIPGDPLHISDTAPVVQFDDTNDAQIWRLLAGGSGYRVEDNSAGNVPFLIEAGASTDSLRIDSTGSVGIGVSAPNEELHVSGDMQLTDGTPRIVFDNTTGDNVQWVIDENGDDFRIQADGTTRMHFDEFGNNGIGTSSPGKKLHVQGTDASGGANNNVQLKVTNASGTAARRDMLTLENNGEPKFVLSNTNNGETWDFSARTDGFNINLLGTGGPEFRVGQNGFFQISSFGNSTFTVGSTGNVFMSNDVRVEGTLVHSSSRDVKKAVTPVDHQVVLDKLDQLEVAEWSYKKDAEGDRHLSPMAEDFHAAFGLGPDNKHVAPSDLAGVALAAAKALKAETSRLNAEKEALRSENQELRARLERIESSLGLSEE